MIRYIVENSVVVTMMDVKEKLLKEYKKNQQQQVSDDAFRVVRGGYKQDRGRVVRQIRRADES